ncbi:ABC transporter permease subunit [Mesorhizobium sp. M0977]|uniref:amino acid ABC transporter permease n=1 Tax=Mesorhizobium sp. M0977 TaxID=2957039 RepID=UPI0033375852
MAELSAGQVSSGTSVPWWRDERKRAVIWQALVIAALVAAVAFIIVNMISNLGRLGIPLGFDFLSSPAGFAISFSTMPITLESHIGRLIIVGIFNTLLASAISIVLSTVLGFLIGIMRLSRNYLVSRLAVIYIEAFRNVPVLVQLLFWYIAIVKLFPKVRQAMNIGDLMFLSNRGTYVPRPVPQDDFGIVFIVLLIGIAIAVGLKRWATKRQMETGQLFPAISVGLAIVVTLPVLASLIFGNPVAWELPALKGFNFQGGLVLQPELTTLVIGLSVCTGAYIAEIVRGGIIAISHGQTEAALALGLKSTWTLRLVIIPQALRVIVPPLTSQYLNIAKNTTLAGAVGYMRQPTLTAQPN